MCRWINARRACNCRPQSRPISRPNALRIFEIRSIQNTEYAFVLLIPASSSVVAPCQFSTVNPNSPNSSANARSSGDSNASASASKSE